MTKEELVSIMNTVLENANKEKIKNFSTQLSLTKDLGFSSLELAELTVRIEEKSGIDIFNDGIVRTIADVFECLKIST